jgi:hypothetical protein
VCKVVEIWWDLSCQSISIKPTVAIWNSFNSIECKERRYNEEKVIVEKGWNKVGFTHRTSRVCTSPNVDGILPESLLLSNNLSLNHKHLEGEKQKKIENKQMGGISLHVYQYHLRAEKLGRNGTRKLVLVEMAESL